MVVELGAARRSAVRVLVVEDHVDTLRLMVRMLAQEGYHVTAAASAREAVEAARRLPFDVLIVDLGLPDSDGWTLAREIRADKPVPVIALSGHAYPHDIERSRQEGFCVHLTKPVDLRRLVEAIEDCHAGKL